jgi:hypothetical protein
LFLFCRTVRNGLIRKTITKTKTFSFSSAVFSLATPLYENRSDENENVHHFNRRVQFAQFDAHNDMYHMYLYQPVLCFAILVVHCHHPLMASNVIPVHWWHYPAKGFCKALLAVRSLPRVVFLKSFYNKGTTLEN